MPLRWNGPNPRVRFFERGYRRDPARKSGQSLHSNQRTLARVGPGGKRRPATIAALEGPQGARVVIAAFAVADSNFPLMWDSLL